MKVSRRQFLDRGLRAGASFLSANVLWGSASVHTAEQGPGYGPLKASNIPELLLPDGFSGRIVARSTEPVRPASDFTWHAAPDGGACFADDGGGWIYVSNSELTGGQGGASAIRFDASGNIIDSYPILRGTNRNCAGGATPWDTWLSCEEPLYEQDGLVYECDPWGKRAAIACPAMGMFCHEAVAVDLDSGYLYMTEDTTDGCLYRFVPDSYKNNRADLQRGILQVACWSRENEQALSWQAIPDPSAASTRTRYQVEEALHFRGGEGVAWQEGRLLFTTKHDNRLWQYDTRRNRLSILYDVARSPSPDLHGVDNVAIDRLGRALVAEDGGNMQIVMVDREGHTEPLVQVVGHNRSEVAGPAFSPRGDRLFFSSQWGSSGRGHGRDGITFEVRGPFVS